MGFGDVLLAAGIAESMFRDDPSRGPVAICNCDGKPRWREEWAGNPAILQSVGLSALAAPTLRIGKGCLPYERGPRIDRGTWNVDESFQARDYPATLYFTPAELEMAAAVKRSVGPFLLMEPTGHDRKNPNRRWPSTYWAALADLIRDQMPLALVQLDRPSADRIPGVRGIPHSNFRAACAILAQASLAVMTEGGLAIGAAAVKAPAVVLWGGCVSPETFGYPQHVNLFDDGPKSPCNMLYSCEHCAAIWARLTPEIVAGAVVRAWNDMEVRHGAR